MLQFSNLTCERDQRVLFSQLSGQVTAGDIVQIVGPNGAGKTTLLRILAGLSQEYSGDILWPAVSGPSEHSSAHAQYDFYSNLLYLGHLPGVNTALTPLENLAWYFGLNGIKSQSLTSNPSRVLGSVKGDGVNDCCESHFEQALTKVGLQGYSHVAAGHLSAGQQRRVALARLYCSHAKLWILDEPFTAIDKAGVTALEQCFTDHAQQGGMVILTTHQSLSIDGVQYIDLCAHEGEVA